MIKKNKVTVYIEHLICECGEEMFYTYEICGLNGTDRYKHKCKTCGNIVYEYDTYPKRVEEE